ncbi:hypothetical protein SGFS_078160 [Streptomyces graminofaciens]|uniref:Uncharacterized protein n=1 Tax=Streptomyces graminofaciens TaxID=68212 RepID=A0ABM7FJ98_9ACTN|nr:hypothetical protein [Streptomyces graminofaciens]BBC36522.1 hypothetical protein SGFS_078160 [Streptomyces graminofaciens]
MGLLLTAEVHMRKAVAGLVAAGVFLAGAGTAVADSWRGMRHLRSTGVGFERAEYRFNPTGKNHGSFEWKGYLVDRIAGDDHNVYMQARAEGHNWSRYDGKQRRTVFLHHSTWSGAQQYRPSSLS